MSKEATDNDGPRRHRRPGRPEHDYVVAELVAGALLGDPAVRAARLEILVQNGVAIVQGSVPTADVRCAILDRVRSTPGIRDLVNQLAVKEQQAER